MKRVLLLLLLLASVADAAPSKIFVASYGNDANAGSIGSPKRNFQTAHDAVADGGQIVVLDTAGYGAVNIIKNVSITVPPGVNGFITVSGSSNGITISGPTNLGVTLRGLIIEGGGQNAGGTGIEGSKAAYLVLESCTIRGFTSGVAQFTAGSSTSLTDCVLIGCYNGFYLEISSVSNTSVNISHCRFELNGGTAVTLRNYDIDATQTINVADSILYRNQVGIDASGVVGQTGKSNVLVSNCLITNNAKGVASNSDTPVITRGNNTLVNNGDGNVFTGSYSAQ